MPTEFTATHRVQFSETDMAGVVHFSNFFRWMEEVEHAWFRSVGLSVAMLSDEAHVGWPRVSASCDFFAPVRFEEEVQLVLRIVKLGKKSLNYEVEFLSAAGKRIALGKTTSVCCQITPEGMKSIPIPPAIRQKLESGSAQ
jgi:YbgC/YbaW family acyl-CoA thioester hydrolase